MLVLQSNELRSHQNLVPHTFKFTNQTPPPQPTPPLGHKLGVMVLSFAVSDSWGLFTQNILPGKNRIKSCTLGGPQSKTVIFENKISITLDCNYYWFLNEITLIVFVLITIKKSLLEYFTPMTATSKSHDFTDFLEKLETSWNHIAIQSNKNFIFKSAGLTLVPGYSFSDDFFFRKDLRKKTSAIKNSKN